MLLLKTTSSRRAGAWYTFDGDQLGQGREKAKLFLRENPEVAMQLQALVMTAVGLVEEDEDEQPVEADALPSPEELAEE